MDAWLLLLFCALLRANHTIRTMSICRRHNDAILTTLQNMLNRRRRRCLWHVAALPGTWAVLACSPPRLRRLQLTRPLGEMRCLPYTRAYRGARSTTCNSSSLRPERTCTASLKRRMRVACCRTKTGATAPHAHALGPAGRRRGAHCWRRAEGSEQPGRERNPARQCSKRPPILEPRTKSFCEPSLSSAGTLVAVVCASHCYGTTWSSSSDGLTCHADPSALDDFGTSGQQASSRASQSMIAVRVHGATASWLEPQRLEQTSKAQATPQSHLHRLWRDIARYGSESCSGIPLGSGEGHASWTAPARRCEHDLGLWLAGGPLPGPSGGPALDRVLSPPTQGPAACPCGSKSGP